MQTVLINTSTSHLQYKNMGVTKYLPRIDWRRVIIWLGHIAFWLIEILFKLLALVAGTVAVGSPGRFGNKLSSGFTSLSSGLRNLVEAPYELIHYGRAILDYNALTPVEFEKVHGRYIVASMMDYFGEIATLVTRIFSNFGDQPLQTLAAGVLAFGAFWLLGRIVRFARQRGRGSVMVRLEQRMGRTIYGRPELVPKNVALAKSKTASHPNKTMPDTSRKTQSSTGKDRKFSRTSTKSSRKSRRAQRKKDIADQLPANGTFADRRKKPASEKEKDTEGKPVSPAKTGEGGSTDTSGKEKSRTEAPEEKTNQKPIDKTVKHLGQALREARSS